MTETILNTSTESNPKPLEGCIKSTHSVFNSNDYNLTSETVASPNQPISFISATSSTVSDTLAQINPTTPCESSRLHNWFDENYSRLLYLSQHDTSFLSAHLLPSLKNKLSESNTLEKNIIQFLLILKKLTLNQSSLDFITLFFIEKIFENYRSLLNYYQEYLVSIKNLDDKIYFIHWDENEANLRFRLNHLKKEKIFLMNQKEKIIPEKAILPLAQRVKDLEKFKYEQARDFEKEIAEQEENLKVTKQSLSNVHININHEATFFDSLLNFDIKSIQRQISNDEIEHFKLGELGKTIDSIDLLKTIHAQLKLERKRHKLVIQLKNINFIAIYKESLEKPLKKSNKKNSDKNDDKKKKVNTHQEETVKEKALSKIKKLAHIKARLNEIAVLLETFLESIQFILFDDNDILSRLCNQLNSNLLLNKERTEALKQKEVLKQKDALNQKNTSKEKEVIDPKELEKEILKQENTLKQECDSELLSMSKQLIKNQKGLIKFLSTHATQLKALFIALIKKRKEILEKNINTLNEKKINYELLNEEKKLIHQINECKEKIDSIKGDQQLWETLSDNKMVSKLNCLIMLEKELNEYNEHVKQYQTQLDYLLRYQKNNDHFKLSIQINQCKENLTYYLMCSNTNKFLTEQYKAELDDQLKAIKTKNSYHWKERLLINEKEIRFNQRETDLILTQIERLNFKKKAKETEELLLKTVSDFPNNHWIFFSQSQKLFLNQFNTQLNHLKSSVNSPEWNRLGWGFFQKKSLMV